MRSEVEALGANELATKIEETLQRPFDDCVTAYKSSLGYTFETRLNAGHLTHRSEANASTSPKNGTLSERPTLRKECEQQQHPLSMNTSNISCLENSFDTLQKSTLGNSRLNELASVALEDGQPNYHPTYEYAHGSSFGRISHDNSVDPVYLSDLLYQTFEPPYTPPPIPDFEPLYASFEQNEVPCPLDSLT